MANRSDPLPIGMAIRASSVRLAGLMVILCSFVAIGVWMIGDANMLGWFELAFFGVGALVLAIALARGIGHAPGGDGFTMATTWRRISFDWRGLSPFAVGYVARQRMILFDDGRHGNLSDIARRLTGRNCAILSVLISSSIEDVCDQLNAFGARAK
jgi:hypothetical protein